MQLYQKRIARAYNIKIKSGKIKEGDLVLKHIKPLLTDLRGKFKPNWEGPYLLKKIFSKGAAILSNLEGNKLRNPINLDKLKNTFCKVSLERKPQKEVVQAKAIVKKILLG